MQKLCKPEKLKMDVSLTLHATPLGVSKTRSVSLRRDQLILVNKAVNEKEQLEKGSEEEEEK
jgi:hypothetical protein